MNISGTAVKALRQRRNWTQRYLAELIEVSERTIQRIEKNGTCELDTRAALASVFEVELDELLDIRHRALDEARPLAIPISPRALFAYLSSHSHPLRLTHQIAERRYLKVGSVDSESAWLNEQLEKLRIGTVRELDDLLHRYSEEAIRLSDYGRSQGAIDPGFIIGSLLIIVAIQRGGKAGLYEFLEGLRFTHFSKGLIEELYSAYAEITAYQERGSNKP